MCSSAVINFGRSALRREDIKGKRILEVGSRNVNGSLRATVEAMEPMEYRGVDLELGPSVDEVCDVHDIVSAFGAESRDGVICTEMLEHVEDWRGAINNLKSVLKPGGFLLLTTRGPGFPLHNYPGDYWRFTCDDMKRIFEEFWFPAPGYPPCILRDPQDPGVFVFGYKPIDWRPVDLDEIHVWSVTK